MKNALVTGANSGMGKVTSEALLRMGYDVSMVCRNTEKGKELEAELAGKFPGNVHLFLADLSSVKEVHRLSMEIKSRLISLDVLINNAGAVNAEREVTVDGYERTFATNHLAYFQLGNELLELLRKSDDARIINVASQAQQMGRLNWDDLQMEKKYSGLLAYCNSKMLNVMYTYALADRLHGTNVKVNAVHPGPVSTGFGKSATGWLGFIFRNLGWTMRKPERGADTAIWLATSEEAGQYNGLYFSDRKPIRSRPETYLVDNLERLWTVSEELINARLS